MIFEKEIAGRKIVIETGRYAQQAGAAVTVRQGETMILATATAAPEAAPGRAFLPLTVDFEERYYAEGRIPATYFRREGRPELEATLLARLVDRPLRPLFPKYYTNETQIVVSSLSFDGENDFSTLAMIGASAALILSDIPFENAIGAVKIGLIDGEFILNPTFTQMAHSKMSLTVAGTRNAVTTIEMEGHEIPEETIIKAVNFAQPLMVELAEWQYRIREQTGKPKREFVAAKPDTTLVDTMAQEFGEAMRSAANHPDKKTREANTDQVRAKVLERFIDPANPEGQTEEILKAFEVNLKEEVRHAILDNNIRPDGRGAKEIRPISIEIDFLPNRVHGSALFRRGQTQVLNTVTLGGPADARKLDTMVVAAEEEYFLHHYNFPPYSTGEVAPIRQKRRELGHGAMAQRALEPVLPDHESFPYTIRSVSEVLSSNGSSSMASCCAASLALMAAGVPLKTHVAAVGVGLVRSAAPGDNRYVLLTDIQGIEDALGDMDFKCAGTENGITSLHLDVKTTDLTIDILAEALDQARAGRLFILDKMNAVISKPRDYMSPFAPKLTTIRVNPSKIGIVIGPGGKTVRGLQAKTGTKIDISEDGTIIVAAIDVAAATAAIEEIYNLTEEVELGRVYAGKISRIEPYGVFVDLQGGVNGLIHISQLADHRIERIEDEFNLGDEVMAMVTAVDGGKVRLSRRAVLENWTLEEAQAADRGGGKPRGGGDRGRR